MIEAWTQQPLFRATENRQGTSYNFSFLQYYVQFLVILGIMTELVLVIRIHFISIYAIRAVAIQVTNIRFLEKDHSLSLQ